MRSVLLLLTGVLFLNTAFQENNEDVVHIVKIEEMSFNPKVIEIKVGETVRWINQNALEHNVVASDKRFKSKMLQLKGEQFEFTFKETGEFKYFCQPHKMMGMKGSVIVKK